MKAITIWQPYSDAIKRGYKKYETRSWPTKYRGKILIHAAKKPLGKHELGLINKYNINKSELVFGVPVLICELVNCIKIDSALAEKQPQSELDFGDWRVGRYAWELKVIQILNNQPEIRGQQGLWNIDLD